MPIDRQRRFGRDAHDQTSVWFDFEAQRVVFHALVADHAESTDQVLARHQPYNAFLTYGLDILRAAGPQACRIVGLAMLQGYPDPCQAELVLMRLWNGILPVDGILTPSRKH